jgi:hypothetical protein
VRIRAAPVLAVLLLLNLCATGALAAYSISRPDTRDPLEEVPVMPDPAKSDDVGPRLVQAEGLIAQHSKEIEAAQVAADAATAEAKAAKAEAAEARALADKACQVYNIC